MGEGREAQREEREKSGEVVAVTMAAVPLLIWQAVERVSKWLCSCITRHLTIVKRGGMILLHRTRIMWLIEYL